MNKEMFINKESHKELVIGNSREVEKYGNLYCLLDDISLRGESFIITDPRGKKLEYYYEELVQKGYTIYNIDINNYENSDCWNPLDIPYFLFQTGEIDKAKDYLVSMAEEIFMTVDQRRGDEFWGASSANLFVGLAYMLFNVAEKRSMINFSSIYQMAEDGLQDGLRTISSSKNILKYFLDEIYNNDEYSRANINLVVNAPGDTRGGILAVFFQKMRALVMSDNTSNIINQSGIDLQCISKPKTAIFLSYNPEQHNDQIRLVNLFLRQSFLYACDGELPVNYIINDLLGLKYVPYVEKMFLSQCKPNTYVFIDSISLFDKIYKDFSYIFFLTQADRVVYLNRREFFLYAPDYLKEKCSEVDWGTGQENTALVCIEDKLVKIISMMKYDKKNNGVNTKPNGSQKSIWERFDIKTKVIEHQRQKLLFGKEPDVRPEEHILEQAGINRSFISKVDSGTKDIDIDKMIRDIDNKIKELEEEERQQNEIKEIKEQEEIMQWYMIKKYIFKLILVMSVLNILLGILLKFIF